MARVEYSHTNTFSMLRWLSAITFLLAVLSSTLGIPTRQSATLHVLARRNVCVPVSSQPHCPLSWKLNEVWAKYYEIFGKISQRELGEEGNTSEADSGDRCAKAHQQAYCSQFIPRCSDDGNQDFGDVRTNCSHSVYNNLTCSQTDVDEYKSIHFCESLITGKQSKAKCVLPSGPINGDCPQPKFKMPADFLQSYERRSGPFFDMFSGIDFEEYQNFTYSNGSRFFTANCLTQIKAFACPAIYCSKDETILEVEYSQDDCNQFVENCLDKKNITSLTDDQVDSFDNLIEDMKLICTFYPRSSPASTVSTPASISLSTEVTSERAKPSSVRAESTLAGTERTQSPTKLTPTETIDKQTTCPSSATSHLPVYLPLTTVLVFSKLLF